LVTARDRREARAQRDGVVAEAAERLEKTRKIGKTVGMPFNHMVWPDCDRRRLVWSESQRDETGARYGAVSDAAPLAQRAENPLVSAAPARPLMTGVAPLIAELNRLETALGDDHNLVVLGATLRGCRDLRSMRADMRQIHRLAARMHQPLRRPAFALGRRLHVRKPEAFARWHRGSLKQARPQQTAA